MLSFERTEESLRFAYDLANADTTRDGLKRLSSENKFFKGLDQALVDNPLPPFEVLAQYMAPGGSVMTNDETGFHYMSFVLRRKAAGEE